MSVSVRKPKRSRFGNVRQTSSGRWQARYRIPGSKPSRFQFAPHTFTFERDAWDWLTVESSKYILDAFPDKKKPGDVPTLDEYQKTWMAGRELTPRTRHEYERLYEQHVSPTFGHQRLNAITGQDVRMWHVGLGEKTGPTRRAHAYALLRSIMQGAVVDQLITANPCQIRGASRAKRARTIRPASLEELGTIGAHMPDRLRLMVLLASWCMLRFGETVELRRKDVDTRRGVIHVRRGVTTVAGQKIVGAPKTEAGVRDIPIPPHMLDAVRDHLKRNTGKDPESLLFPGTHGGHLSSASLYDYYYPARDAAGRPDLRWHDLRHTGAFLAAATGASLATMMAYGGWSDVRTAMRYQHADDLTKLSLGLSKLAEDG